MTEVPASAADAVATLLQADPAPIAVRVVVVVDDEVRLRLDEARVLRELSADANTQAAASQRAAVALLTGQNWTVREIATALGVSSARAQQLISEARATVEGEVIAVLPGSPMGMAAFRERFDASLERMANQA